MLDYPYTVKLCYRPLCTCARSEKTVETVGRAFALRKHPVETGC